MIRIIWYCLLFFMLLALAVLGVHKLVSYSATDRLYESNTLQKMPKNRVGLVLGTTKILANGRVNLYYKYRIAAAKKLYDAGKLDYLLVSGDNGRKDYDEPSLMREDLIKAGIPANKIYCDYAGFRTLDSIVRSKHVFGQQKLTIISQAFHNERALFLARLNGIDALAYNAKDVSFRYGAKVRVREVLARSKMLLDVLLFTQPKYLGDPIQIG